MSSQIEKSAQQPDSGIARFFRKKKEQETEEFIELTGQVARKLVQGISEAGTVSVFRDKASGVFEQAIFNGYFTSRKLPRLHVWIWKDDVRPSDESLEFDRKYGPTRPRVFIQAAEYGEDHGGRAVDIVQRWDMGPDDWEIIYRRNAIKEPSNLPIPRSTREKMKFLREIMETEIDMGANEKEFGRPYIPGDSWSNDKPTDSTSHRKYWVRDIRDSFLHGLLPEPKTVIPELPE